MSEIENVVAAEIARAISRHLSEKPAAALRSAPVSCDRELAGQIAYTLLKADATEEQIAELCEDAVAYGFSTVCVNSAFVAEAAQRLRGTSVGIASVVGFPLGAAGTQAKAAEAMEAVQNGASEVEMVAHIGMIKSGNWRYFKHDVEEVMRAAGGRAKVHVIIETSLLSDAEKYKACLICRLIGADAVKTSTGFSAAGATTANIRLLREAAGDDLKIIASGGIHSQEEARMLLQAGADRIGTANGIPVVTGIPAQDSAGHVCVGCGTCRQAAGCPTGRVDFIVANNY